jgi:hypothetical protein
MKLSCRSCLSGTGLRERYLSVMVSRISIWDSVLSSSGVGDYMEAGRIHLHRFEVIDIELSKVLFLPASVFRVDVPVVKLFEKHSLFVLVGKLWEHFPVVS